MRDLENGFVSWILSLFVSEALLETGHCTEGYQCRGLVPHKKKAEGPPSTAQKPVFQNGLPDR